MLRQPGMVGRALQRVVERDLHPELACALHQPNEIIVRTDDFKFRSYGSVQVVHPGFGMGVEFVAHTREQADQVYRLIKIVHQNRTADSSHR